MPHVSFEFVLALAYAIFLAVLAFLLELAARHCSSPLLDGRDNRLHLSFRNGISGDAL